jgi:DNA-binding transcriptional ArsR family regulator
MSKNNKEKSIVDVLKSDIRFRIFSLLHLYPELSLSDLSKKMCKSKSTMHHHLKELIDSGLIELSHQEKVRGNIYAKFYSLKSGYLEKLSETESSFQNATSTSIEFFKTYLNFAIRTLEHYKNFFEVFELREDGIVKLKEIIAPSKGFSSMAFFSEEQFKKVGILYQEFIKGVNKIEREENGVKTEKPFYIFTMGLPLKLVIEEMNVLCQSQKK